MFHFVYTLAPPTTCILCDGNGFSGLDLCAACYSNMPFNLPCCGTCALPLAMSTHGRSDRQYSTLCGKCITGINPINEAVIPCLYRPPADFMVRRLKFSDDTKYSRLIGELISKEVKKRETKLPDVLIPVPLHSSRHLQRGFNQAHLIARQISRRMGVPIDDTSVSRTIASDQQSALGARAREKNMRRAFTVTAAVNNRSVAIVDDVFTTGATCFALARSLLLAGACRVDVWAFARTP